MTPHNYEYTHPLFSAVGIIDDATGQEIQCRDTDTNKWSHEFNALFIWVSAHLYIE
jgi:hypothetical protein